MKIISEYPCSLQVSVFIQLSTPPPPLTRHCFHLKAAYEGKNVKERCSLTALILKLILKCSQPEFIVLAWAVQKVENTIHQIYRYPVLSSYPVSIAWFVFLTLIHWIVIYLMDSIIQVSDNWALDYNVCQLEVTIFSS